MRAGQREQARQGIGLGVGDVVGRPALLQPGEGAGRLDRLVLRDPPWRTHDLHPSGVESGLDPVELVEAVVAVLLRPQVARARVEGHPEAVADPVGEEALDVGADLAADGGAGCEERVVARGRAVLVQAQDGSRQVGVVGLRATERVVRHAGPEGPVHQVLHLPATPHVAHQDVELAVRPEAKHPAVVISTLRLPPASGGWRARRPMMLRSKTSAEPFHTKRSTRFPSRGISEGVGVESCAALGPVQVHEPVRREVGMQGDPQQPPLGGEVHG